MNHLTLDPNDLTLNGSLSANLIVTSNLCTPKIWPQSPFSHIT
uniref:Uncharacterized protein n=1 Tax=Rhizophora mucronata TaxID=61149 RepID=A0A2P2NJA2_RHIMU